MKKTEVIVMVKGGLVQAIHTNNPDDIQISIFDLDQPSFETTDERILRNNKERSYEEAIEDLIGVY